MESYVAVRYGRVRLGRLAASQGVQHKVSALRHSDLGQPRYRIAQRWIGALKPLEFSPRFIHAVTAFFVLHIDFRPRRGQKDARVVAMRLGNRVQNSSAVQCLVLPPRRSGHGRRTPIAYCCVAHWHGCLAQGRWPRAGRPSCRATAGPGRPCVFVPERYAVQAPQLRHPWISIQPPQTRTTINYLLKGHQHPSRPACQQ